METYRVHCHCGSVRAKIRLRMQHPLRVWDCNCSDCSMRKNVHFMVPSTDFELDTDNFESATTLYMWGTNTAIRRFCNTCGILPFYIPRSNPDGFAITLACVDFGEGGKPPIEVQSFDGIHWEESYASTLIATQTKGDASITDATIGSSHSIPVVGDGDIWIEQKIHSPRSGKERKLFSSTISGRKFLDEPPTGASKVMTPSLKVLKEGDGDVWVEKKFQSSKSGKQRSFFCSMNTGRKVRDEPPSGASKVLYL